MRHGAPTARLFAALDPSEEVAERLVAWGRSVARQARGAASLRVLAPEALHLTLCFLGERPMEDVEPLIVALATAVEGSRACELELGAPAWLPPRRPRALAVQVGEPTGELSRLQHAVASALWEAVGEGLARGRFRPHITVARCRGEPGRGLELPPTPALGFQAWEAVLYRSWLEPAGARYERLSGALLGGA